MKRQELQAEFDRLKRQIDLVQNGSTGDNDELIALSSQQICVSICGSLEQMLKGIFIEYAKQRSASRIYKPIQKVCEGYQNPKSTKILELVDLFDSEFKEELSCLWDEEKSIERQHLDNLVDDRITIAHRKRVHIDVSTTKLKNYYTAYTGLLDRIFVRFLGAG